MRVTSEILTMPRDESHVFPRNMKAPPPPVAVAGKGVYLYDKDGKKYLDGSGGAAVACLGHGDPDVIEAVKAQMDKLAFAHTGFLSSEPAEELAKLLAAHAPGDLNKVYFVSGGSEAVETAIKLARQYAIESGNPSKHRLIARRQSYHGNTLGALAAGGNEARRKPYAPLLVKHSHIAPCFEYRDRADNETAEEYGLRAANELETEILRVGPDSVMAFIAEPVVGAKLGATTPVPGYFKRIREICDTHNVLLILDEVMCGMGRAGTLFAAEQDGIVPDIVAIAKGLGAGYQPIGATMCSRKIYAAIEQGSGVFQHGFTYVGHPVACAAGVAVFRRLTGQSPGSQSGTNGGLIARCAEQGEKLQAALIERFGQHPHVGDVRGRGLFRGIELVADRETKAAFDPAHRVHARVKNAAFDAGLICYPMGGTIDGINGDHVLLAPPFIISDDEMAEMVDKLGGAIETALADISRT